jgi:hypothetical protein
MKICITLLMAPLAAVWATTAEAQTRPDGQSGRDMQVEQQSCEADVYALCGEFIPDADRITACLRSRWKDVSQSCRSVMANYGRNHKGQRNRRD